MGVSVKHRASSIDRVLFAGGETTKQRTGPEVIAGSLLAVTGIGMILGIITNEALYPAARHYSTFANSISDLSGTEPPNSYMVGQNRVIFIVTMAVGGVLILAATSLLARVIHRRRFIVAMTVFGIGLVGISVFPGNVAGWHPLFAFACFLGGSAAAILSRKVLGTPVGYFGLILGVIALLATVFGVESLKDWGPQAVIGRGGIERWIAYPVLLWLVLMGGAFVTRGRSRVAQPS